MTSRHKKNSILLSVILYTLLFNTGALAMSNVKYIIGLHAENSNCLVRMNGIEVIDSFRTSTGNIITGFDGTPVLENGSNKLTVWFGPAGEQAGSYDFTKPTMCTVTVTAKTPKKSLVISNIIIEANEHLKPTAAKSIYYNGSDLTSPITEEKLSNLNAYEVRRSFNLKEVPTWAWTTASPFVQVPENMQKLRDAYMDIWLAMNSRNLSKMKELTKISVNEEAQHEGISSQLFFDTYEFKNNFKESCGARKITFSNYSVKTFCDGRLIQLQDEYGNSPLELLKKNDPTETQFLYQPYLSLINGKIIISR